jgi:excinuclease ABC subunit C
MTVSELDGVPGLGQARRATLLRHFGSVRKLRAAAVSEIAALPGFGQRTAEAVYAALHADAAGDDSGGGAQPRDQTVARSEPASAGASGGTSMIGGGA